MPAAKKKTTVRNDPQVRPINAGSPYFTLENASPDRKYVWVFKGAAEFGPDYYEGLGYTPVQYTPGGVKGRIGKSFKSGEIIESRGHILMECTQERATEIFEDGEDGVSGQKGADVIESRMFQTKKAIAELSKRVQMRSQQGGQYFSFEAEAGSVAVIPTGED
jgi:hypothetical protein